jgi:hypothetical protein
MRSLSFADIERVTVEAIKTMLLHEGQNLSARDLAEELRVWRISVMAARRKRGEQASEF